MKFATALKLSSATLMLCLAAAAANAATPAVTVSPGSNHPSSSTNVSGTGFGASEAVDLYFDTTDEQLAVTNATGALVSTPIAVSASALPGTHYITAIGRRSGLAAQAKFTVATNWTQFHYGVLQKGYNPYENVLSPGTVSGLDLAWSFTSTGPATSPTILGADLYVGAGKTLYALNASSGAIVWPATLGGAAAYQSSAPVVAGGNVYIGAADGKVYAFKASTGAAAWAAPVSIGTDVTSGLTVANGIVYGFSGNTLTALNASTGALRWTHTYQVCSPSPPVAGGVIFFTDCSANLYALNASTGGPIWQTATTGTVVSGLAVANGRILFGDTGANVHAYSTDLGDSIWTENSGAMGLRIVCRRGKRYRLLRCGFHGQRRR